MCTTPFWDNLHEIQWFPGQSSDTDAKATQTGYAAPELSLQELYGRHHDLVGRYTISISQWQWIVYVLSSVLWWPLRSPHENDVRFVFTSSYFFQESSLLMFVMCACLRIVVCFCFVLCIQCCQYLWIVLFICPSMFVNVYIICT